jgi:hypothetical protein
MRLLRFYTMSFFFLSILCICYPAGATGRSMTFCSVVINGDTEVVAGNYLMVKADTDFTREQLQSQLDTLYGLIMDTLPPPRQVPKRWHLNCERLPLGAL